MKTQQPVVRGEASNTAAVEAIKMRNTFRPRHTLQKVGSMTAGATPGPQKCSRCGKSPPHGRQQCPANDAVCHGCHKRGHYKRCCKTKAAIREITEDSEEEVFLGTVSAETTSPWIVKVQLNGDAIEFKVDTGADVTAIPERMYSRERDGKLQPSSLPLNGPTGENLKVRGRFSGCLSRNTSKCEEDIYVVRNLRRPLLGGNWQ